jgi:ABC-type oligopeptide transport system substrate-binding subunit
MKGNVMFKNWSCSLPLAFLLLLGVFLAGCEDDDSASDDTPETNAPPVTSSGGGTDTTPELGSPYSASVTGLFQTVSNPATTIPPLPGVVDVVIDGQTEYILTSNGSWFQGDFTWGGARPAQGNTSVVDGVVSEHLDIYDGVYRQIEITQFQVITNTP